LKTLEINASSSPIKPNQGKSSLTGKKTHHAKTRQNPQIIGQIRKKCFKKHRKKLAIFARKPQPFSIASGAEIW